MSWNDPGNDNKQAPPDLEKMVKGLFDKIKRSNPRQRRSDDPNDSGDNSKMPYVMMSIFLGLFLAALWALSGIFIVSPGEEAVVLRFGKYSRTVTPGPHWIPRFVDSRYILNVQNIMDYQYQAEMLTRDENIIMVGLAVQYRIDNAKDFLFSVVNPIESLRQVTTSILRQVVGDKKLDDVLRSGETSSEEENVSSAELATRMGEETAQEMSILLSRYKTGLKVTKVSIQFIKPPEAVIDAFDDVIIAGEDKVRYIREAEAFQKKVVLEAGGLAQKHIEKGIAESRQKVAFAEGQTAEYLGELPQYKLTPDITRSRLYLSTMKRVFENNPKVMITTQNSNNLLYLPIDKLMRKTDKPASENKANLTLNLRDMPERTSVRIDENTTRSSRQFTDRGIQ